MHVLINSILPKKIQWQIFLLPSICLPDRLTPRLPPISSSLPSLAAPPPYLILPPLPRIPASLSPPPSPPSLLRHPSLPPLPPSFMATSLLSSPPSHPPSFLRINHPSLLPFHFLPPFFLPLHLPSLYNSLIYKNHKRKYICTGIWTTTPLLLFISHPTSNRNHFVCEYKQKLPTNHSTVLTGTTTVLTGTTTVLTGTTTVIIKLTVGY